VSELKRTAIFSGLASLNENVDRRISKLRELRECWRGLGRRQQQASRS